ncbi:MAG: hypothetical protein EBY22_16770, partial [Gammaproteobacteria bacterium]|nr:hypothetical protein [Gammaproteobacteria bacterium]
TLAAEQRTHKDQLKAHKKSATIKKNNVVQTTPKGATSLFDFGDDLDALAAASGAASRSQVNTSSEIAAIVNIGKKKHKSK